MKHILRSGIAGTALLVFGSSFCAEAQSGAAFTIQKATSRKEVSVSGRDEHGHGGHTEVEFTILWQSPTPPSAIFYRPDAAHWLKCEAFRPERRTFGGGPNDFAVVDMRAKYATFKAGEGFKLRPEEFPSEVQPNAVKSMATGALFYQIGNSRKWQVMKVTLTKLPDLKRP